MTDAKAELTESEWGWVLLGAIGLDDVGSCLDALEQGEPALEKSGMKALNRAAEWGAQRCARALMDSGRDWRALDEKGYNALDAAAIHNAHGCAREIVESQEVAIGLLGRALVEACSSGSAQVASVLAEKIPSGEPFKLWSGAALMGAAKAQSSACVKAAIASRPEGGWDENQAKESMAWACQSQHAEMLAALLDSGWSVDQRVQRTNYVELYGKAEHGGDKLGDEDGVSVLDWAAANNAWGCARLLLERGALVDACHRKGSTLLMRAARGGAATVARMVVERGVDVNQRDAQGYTALMWASQYSAHGSVVGPRVSMARALLSVGAQAAERDHQQWDALDWFLSRYGMEKDIEALCEKIDPRERVARAGQFGWALPRKNTDISPLAYMVLASASRAWSAKQKAAQEIVDLNEVVGLGFKGGRSARL
jgi:hypothetical protein